MRPKFRSMLVVLIGALALAAVASASASATLPEFQQGGKALAKTVKLTGKGGAVIFASKNKAEWTCGGSSLTGETSGASDVANIVVKFTGCTLGGVKITHCTSPGAEEEEMISTQLSGRLGYINKKTEYAGLLLEPPTGKLIAECSSQQKTPAVELRGSVIGRITPVNKETTKFTLTYAVSGATERYKQEPTHFEGEEVIHTLETAILGNETFYQTGIETKIEITTGEALEIKA
jgi:hypothetical protein